MTIGHVVETVEQTDAVCNTCIEVVQCISLASISADDVEKPYPMCMHCGEAIKP